MCPQQRSSCCEEHVTESHALVIDLCIDCSPPEWIVRLEKRTFQEPDAREVRVIIANYPNYKGNLIDCVHNIAIWLVGYNVLDITARDIGCLISELKRRSCIFNE